MNDLIKALDAMPELPEAGRTIWFNHCEYRRQDTITLKNVRQYDVVLLDNVHTPYLVRAIVGRNTTDVQYVLITEAHVVSRGQNELVSEPALQSRIQLLYSPVKRRVIHTEPSVESPTPVPVRERAIDLS